MGGRVVGKGDGVDEVEEVMERPTRGVKPALSRSESCGRRIFFGRTRRRLIEGTAENSSGELSHFERRFPGVLEDSPNPESLISARSYQCNPIRAKDTETVNETHALRLGSPHSFQVGGKRSMNRSPTNEYC